MDYIIIAVIILIVVMLYTFIKYRSLSKNKIKIETLYQNLDELLKMRWNLIPEIVKLLKTNESTQKPLQELIVLKNRIYDNLIFEDKVILNDKIDKNIAKIIIKINDIKDKDIKELTKKLIKLEEEIYETKNSYNKLATKINKTLRRFPTSIIAYIFDFRICKIFEIKQKI